MLAERYRLDSPLGRGGMGEVWQGRDERLGRAVAVKMLPGHAADEGLEAQFAREARTAARLNHPHVVAVYDFGVSGGRCFLVMELVDGPSLADALREDGPPAPARVAALAAQVAAGLAAAHQRGVVHRDIKPSNLLLAHDGTIKIADFGIARAVSGDTTMQATQPGVITGTSAYVSPETAMGRPAEAAGDVYSLGCALYELLTGRPPFVADTPIAVLWQHVEARPADPAALNPAVPRALGAYVLAMLAKDPADRPTAEQAAAFFDGETWHGPARAQGAAGDLPGSTLRQPVLVAEPPAPVAAAAGLSEAPRQERPGAPSGRGRRVAIGAAAVATVLTVAGLATTPWSSHGDAGPGAPAATSPSPVHTAGQARQPGHQDASEVSRSPAAPAGGPHARGRARPSAGPRSPSATATARPRIPGSATGAPSTPPATPHSSATTPTATTTTPAPSAPAPGSTPSATSTSTSDPGPSVTPAQDAGGGA